MGLAGDLDKLTEEFKFLLQSQTNSKCIPIQKSGKLFAIEKAYEQFAFMKSLERHREQQFNSFDWNFSEETDSVNEIVIVIMMFPVKVTMTERQERRIITSYYNLFACGLCANVKKKTMKQQ